jgi:hypothetical protein
MPAEQADGFADNWTYLRTELQWLERLLIAAVAKQRKDLKEVDRIAQSKADRATSHWWKGIITPDGNICYDDYRQPVISKPSYHIQLEAQIQTSQNRGVVLALPALSDRLGLSLFEKNLVLIGLAPEVNRRYARLYRFLQGNEDSKTDLPTLDLALRLFCKNDQEWRVARNHLVNSSRLLSHKLLHLLPAPENTVLNAPLKLDEPLVNYLLAEKPTAQTLDQLLSSAASRTGAATSSQTGSQIRVVSRSNALVWLQQTPVKATEATEASNLPSPVTLDVNTLAALNGLGQRIQGHIKAAKQWKLTNPSPGLMVLLSGVVTADKTLAARTLSSGLQKPLYQINLAAVEPIDYPEVLAEITHLKPTLLLIQSAEHWLKRSSLLPAALLYQFWTERRNLPAITLFSVAQTAVAQRHIFDQQIQFAPLNPALRLQIWQQSFPSQVPLAANVNWSALAELPLSREEINTLSQEAIAYAAVNDADTVELNHIVSALAQRGIVTGIKPLKAKRKAKSKISEMS